MACVGSVTTIDFLSGEGTETNMAEATQTTVSRRSTRLFVKDQDSAEVGTAGIAYESRYGSSSDEKEKEKEKERPARETGPPSGNVDARLVPIVDLGIDLSGMFPTTAEDMGKQGMLSPHFLGTRPSTLFRFEFKD
jgi:tyrosine-protein phosphatase SIW14